MASDVSLAFNAVGRDRGVNALLARTSSNVRAANLAAAASTVAMGAAMASAGAHALALAGSAAVAAGAIAAVPAALAAGYAGMGAYKAVTFGLADAWKATGVAATGGGGAARNAGQQAVSNARAVRDATEALSAAKRDEALATAAVNRARAEEKERLEDLSRSLAGSKLDEESATLAVAKAAQDLAVAKAGGSNQAILEADLAYRQSQQTLVDTKDRVQDLSAEQAAGAKKGVEGSDAVQEALRRQQDAQQQVTRAAEQLADAQQKVQQASAGAAGGGLDPAAAALARLSPNGRAVILMLRQLAPAWQGAARAGQQATLAGVTGELRDLSGIYLPRATSWLTRMGASFNLAIRQSLGLAQTKNTIRDVDVFTTNVALSTDRLARAIKPVINGVLQWVTIGSNFLPGLASNTLTIAQRFERWSVEMRKSGQAASWIGNGIAMLRQFAAVAQNVVYSIIAVVHAGGDGGSTLNFLVRGSAAMRKFLESAQGQQKIQQLFAVLRGVLSAVGPLLGSVAGHSGELGQSMSILASSAKFAVDNLGPLLKYLPVLAAGYLLLKHTGIAAGVGLGVKAFQIASQFAMAAAIRAHTTALRENTVASGGAAVATGTNTAAENTGILSRGRAIVGMVAQKAALIASTVATRAAAAGQWLLNAAMSANPLGLIVIAIAAVAAGLYLLWTHSATFRKIVTGAFGAVWGVIKIGWEWVRKNWPLLLAILSGPIGIAVLVITKYWGTIKAGAGAVKDWVVAKFTALTSWFSGLPSRLGKALGKLGSFLTAPFRAAFNGIAGLWNRTLGGFRISVPTWVPKFGGNSLTLPHIPMLARGGVVPATSGGRLIVAGEAGEDEAVIPLSKLGSTGAAGGGGPVRVWFDFTGVETEFKRFMRKAIRTDNLLQPEG
jgi:hypothetical protein